MTTDDMDLVREYAARRSDEAFAAVVSRHVNLVYSVALRRLSDASLAEEVTQATFIILARKASSLGSKTILSAWLCRTAQYVAARALRDQYRRQRREQEVYMQSWLNQADSDSETWTNIAPLLDGAMAGLRKKDHAAIVLRFFDGKDMKDVGAALGVSENAANKRVNFALEKLRKFFGKRGVTLTTALIAGAISAHSVQAAPAPLANTVVAATLGKGAAASSSTLTLVKTTLKMIMLQKMKTAILASAAGLLIAGTTTVAVMEAGAASPNSDGAALQGTWDGAQLRIKHHCTFIVSGNNYEIQDAADTNAWNKGTFTLRTDTNPRQCIFSVGECHVPQYVGSTIMAIYKLERGKLTITWNAPGKPDAPAAFDVRGAACMELTRDK